MKLIFKILLIGILSYFAGMVLPWWIIAVCAFVVAALIPTGAFNAFVSGFIGVGLLWLVMAWMLDTATNSIMTKKIAALQEIGDPLFLIIGTGLVGAIIGGFGALTGNNFRRLFIRKKKQSLYH